MCRVRNACYFIGLGHDRVGKAKKLSKDFDEFMDIYSNSYGETKLERGASGKQNTIYCSISPSFPNALGSRLKTATRLKLFLWEGRKASKISYSG